MDVAAALAYRWKWLPLGVDVVVCTILICAYTTVQIATPVMDGDMMNEGKGNIWWKADEDEKLQYAGIGQGRFLDDQLQTVRPLEPHQSRPISLLSCLFA